MSDRYSDAEEHMKRQMNYIDDIARCVSHMAAMDESVAGIASALDSLSFECHPMSDLSVPAIQLQVPLFSLCSR